MKQTSQFSLKLDKNIILSDFRLANLSRSLSITGRKEVLSGKAKFGIFGDGKELIQIALAKQFKAGDWRSGYYRDQTFMLICPDDRQLPRFAVGRDRNRIFGFIHCSGYPQGSRSIIVR